MADKLPPRLTFQERNATLNTRIRESELFPRIRDAEAAMVKEEIAYQQRLRNKDLRRRQSNNQTATVKRSVHSPIKPAIVANEYFSSHILNRDPQCSKYMPFDVVYFPRLFNQNDATYAPDSIDQIWMQAFQHLSTNASKITEKDKIRPP
eukprot:gene7077-7828_t